MPDSLASEDAAFLAARVAFALAIGFLIGLERGWRHRQEASGERLAGIRTHMLYGLAGGVAGVFPPALAGWAIASVVIAAAAMIVAGYVGELSAPQPDRGLTSEIAAVATVLLGALAGQGELVIAAAGAVMVVLVLSLKKQLHAFVDLISYEEIHATTKLLVISVLVLPFLPDRGFGPEGVLNPYQIWWAVVLIAALSFAGYVAIRILGERNGPLAFGILGGLASSTATTVTAARFARLAPAECEAFAGAIGAASAVMMVRVAVLLAIFAPLLLALAWPALAAGAAASLLTGVGLTLLGRAQETDAALTLKPPDDLWFAVTLGGLLALAGVAIVYAERALGDAGLYALAGLSGTVDVDVFTLSAARNAGRSADLLATRDAVLLAVAVNTVVKAAIAWSVGGSALGRRVALIVAASVLAGAAAWLAS